LLTSSSFSRTKLQDRVNKAKIINLKRIEILYIRDFNSHYITTNDFFKLELFIKLLDRSSRNSKIRIIEFANLRILYLNICVDVTFNVLLICKKLLVIYIAIKKEQIVIANLIVEVNRLANVVKKSQS